MKGLVKRFNSSRSVVQIAHSCQVNRSISVARLREGSRRRVVLPIVTETEDVLVVERASLARPTFGGRQHRALASSDRLSSNPGSRSGGVLECAVLRFVLGLCVGPSPGGIASSRSVAAGNPGRARSLSDEACGFSIVSPFAWRSRIPARREDVPPPNGAFSSAIKTRPRFRPRSGSCQAAAGRGHAPSRRLSC